MAQILAEVGITIVITFFLALILKRFNQPALVAYLLSGLLLGPFFLNILTYRSHYELLAHIGVSTLLFIVGLQLNLTFIRNVGKIAIITGMGQIVFTSIVGMAIVVLFGFDLLQSLIIAIALTFSSTIIIVKLLSEKKSLNTIHGKISLGFLLVQDVAAVIILLLLASTFGTESNMAITVLTVLGITVAAFWLAKHILSQLFAKLESEMQVLLALGWCLGLAGLMQFLGLSIEIGALIAGVSLASSGASIKISRKLTPFRDFFLVIFFVFLGAEMFPTTEVAGNSFADKMSLLVGSLADIALPTLVLSIFVLIGNPLIVFLMLTRLRYSARTSFLSGLAVSQISEFSIIITLLARNAGILSQEVVSLITFIAITTILGSTYLFYHGEQLFKLMPFLNKMQAKVTLDTPQGLAGTYHKYILFGSGDHSMELMKHLHKKRKSYILFDIDYYLIQRLKEEGYNAEIGNAADPTFLEELNLKKPTFIVSTIHDLDVNAALLDATKRHKKVKLISFAKTKNDVDYLLDEGAYEVIHADHLLKRQIEKVLKL